MTPITATAHTNIALIKYWGKLAGNLNISATSSLSLTLDLFFTTTSVEFNDATQDYFELNGISQHSTSLERVTQFINLFRTLTGINRSVIVRSHNSVPTASGLASSASGFAALTIALAQLFSLPLDRRQLSRLARQGSGSAARSLFGGFSLLHGGEGISDQGAFAEPIQSPLLQNIRMLVVECSKTKKAVGSREGMLRTQNSSVFYKDFLQSNALLLRSAQSALESGDFERLGSSMEQSTLQMHATMLGCKEPFWYFNGDSIKAMSMVRELRASGYSCYLTMDAGPHVKVLCPATQSAKLHEILSHETELNVNCCSPGPEAYVHA